MGRKKHPPWVRKPSESKGDARPASGGRLEKARDSRGASSSYSGKRRIRKTPADYLDLIQYFLLFLMISVVPGIFRVYTSNVCWIKTVVLACIVLAGYLVWFGWTMFGGVRFRFRRTPLDLPILAFVLVLLVTSFISRAPEISLSEMRRYLLFPLAYWLIVNFIRSEKRVMNFMQLLIVTGALCCAYSSMQAFGVDPVGWDRAFENGIFGSFGHPNSLAGYLVVILPICAAYIVKSILSRRWLEAVLTFIISALIAFNLLETISNGAYAGLFAAAFALLAMWALSNRTVGIVFLVVALIVVALIAIPGFAQNTLVDFVQSNYFRVDTYKGSLRMFADKPILGHGFGTYFLYYPPYMRTDYVRRNPNATNLVNAHGEYLQVADETGFFGSFAFWWLMIAGFFVGARTWNKIRSRNADIMAKGAFASLIAVATHAAFSVNMRWTANYLFLWISLGLVVVFSGLHRKYPVVEYNISRWRVVPKAAFIGILFLVSVLTVNAESKRIIADRIYFEGQEKLRQRNWRVAIDKMERAVDIYPYWMPTYYDLGYAYSTWGKTNEALECYGEITKYTPYYQQVQQNLAAAYSALRQYDKVIECYKTALEADYSEDKLYDLANAYINIGDRENAARYFSEFLRIAVGYYNSEIERLNSRVERFGDAAWRVSNRIFFTLKEKIDFAQHKLKELDDYKIIRNPETGAMEKERQASEIETKRPDVQLFTPVQANPFVDPNRPRIKPLKPLGYQITPFPKGAPGPAPQQLKSAPPNLPGVKFEITPFPEQAKPQKNTDER